LLPPICLFVRLATVIRVDSLAYLLRHEFEDRVPRRVKVAAQATNLFFEFEL